MLHIILFLNQVMGTNQLFESVFGSARMSRECRMSPEKIN